MDIDKLILKFTRKDKRIRIANKTLKEKKNRGQTIQVIDGTRTTGSTCKKLDPDTVFIHFTNSNPK